MDILLTPEPSVLDAQAQLDLEISRGARVPATLAETHLQNKPRGVLVDELMRDPLYSDRKILSHLSKQKLARMVLQSRERIAAVSATEPERLMA